MWWPAVSFCLLSLASLTNCQDQQAGLDYSEEDYSTKLQQFLLQKLQEAETFVGEEGKRGRQDLDLDDDDELPEIIDADVIDNEDNNEEKEEASGDQGEEEEEKEEESEEVIVLNAAPFLMSSLVSELSADIVLQEVTGSDRLTMICRVSLTSQSEIFSDQTCLPQIYLVAGQADCNSLTQVTVLTSVLTSVVTSQHFQEFSAKKLASVHGPGEGKTKVDATWSELPGKCLVVLRENECEGSGGNLEGSGQEENVIVDTRRQARPGNILSPASLGRSYSTFSLTSFSILSSGSSSRAPVTIIASLSDFSSQVSSQSRSPP